MGYRYPSLFSHLTDLHSIFKLYAENGKGSISLNTSASEFFQQHKDRLLYSCRDQRLFSHCQPHYIFSYSSVTNQFSSFVISSRIVYILVIYY